ncbi:MAG: alpha/beta hydrolase [Phycisphaeraceae bacterium]|nr:alpha/beta hydrolase [Phycisphaeraceae bacterium]
MLGFAILLIVGLALAVIMSALAVVRRLRNPPRKTYSWAVARNKPGDPGELPNPRAFDAYTLNLESAPSTTPVWNIAGDDPRGPVIIYTPGWGDSRLGVLPRLTGLAPNASRIIAWDPPGHGEAQGLCTLGTREDRVLRDLIEHAHSTHPDRPVILYGASLGGGVSIVCAANQDCPPCVAGVISEAAYRFPWVPARNVIRMSNLPWAINGPLAFAYLGFRLRAGYKFSHAHSGGGVGGVGRARGFDRAKHAAHLRVPLLLIHGDHDEVCPIEDSRAMHDAANNTGAGALLVVVEGGSHNDLWTNERSVHTVAHAVSDFIARAASGAMAHLDTVE